jgi:glucosylceramidase
MDAAFRNPDGSTALVVHNENDNPATFAVAQGDASFDYTLPGGALATFVWPASGALDNGLRLLPADPMIATATPPGGADAAKAVDDDASTRWTTGAAQQPGQTLQVDLGSVVAARRLVLDTGPDTSDYPRGYAVSTSVDGTTWSVPLTGPGTGQLTNIALPGDPARYVRVVQTGTAAQWWTVADLRVYR